MGVHEGAHAFVVGLVFFELEAEGVVEEACDEFEVEALFDLP
jgi:hypothetical protein